MYNTSTGLILGIILSLTLNTLLGFSIKSYSPPPVKERKKYENVKMKINKIKKEIPKKEEPKIEEVKKEEPKKEEPKKEEPKKEIKKIKKVVKKEEPKKEEIKKEIPKNPINEKKEVKEEQKEVKKSSTPVFGVSMNSISGSGGGATFQVQVGNTLMTDYKTGWENGKPKEVGVYDGGSPGPVKEVAVVKAPPLKIKEKAVPKKVVRPAYTKAAKDAEVEGSIVLKLEIDKKGSVTNAKIIKGLGFGLDEEALKAVKQFFFEPAILSNGEKTASIITYTINFVLQD